MHLNATFIIQEKKTHVMIRTTEEEQGPGRKEVRVERARQGTEVGGVVGVVIVTESAF